MTTSIPSRHNFPSIQECFHGVWDTCAPPCNRLQFLPLLMSAAPAVSSILGEEEDEEHDEAGDVCPFISFPTLTHQLGIRRHSARGLVSSPGLMVFLRAPSTAQICQLIRWKPSLHGHDHSKELPKSGDANKQTVEIKPKQTSSCKWMHGGSNGREWLCTRHRDLVKLIKAANGNEDRSGKGEKQW